MSDINTLFTNASRSKSRFQSSVGLISTEDLWDLPLTGRGANLDDIAKGLNRQVKDADTDVSFVKPVVKSTSDLQDKLEIVKYIINVKISERDAKAETEKRAATKQLLLSKLEAKQNAALDNLSEDELKSMLASL